MTVSNQLTKRIYAGNGTTREWDIDFPLVSINDLHILITSPAGEETSVTENFAFNTDYDAIIYPTLDSGLEPLAAGWTITLVRQTPLTQNIDLLRQGELDAEVLEGGYDKLTMQLQELSEKIGRSIKYPISSQPSDLDAGNFLHEILTAKQAALTASGQAVSAAQSASSNATAAAQSAQSAVEAIQTATQTGQSALTAQAQTLTEQFNTLLASAQTAAQNAQYYAQRTLGKNIGEVYFHPSSSAADNPGALPLFTGETISNADQLYPDFYTWVSEHLALQISAVDYETALATYGECPKYVIDTTNKTIRLPKLVNYLKMANATDGVTLCAAGLPNITGEQEHLAWATRNSGPGTSGTGVFSTTTSSGGEGANTGDAYNTAKIVFDASGANSIYGNSNTVTPSHTTLFPWVCAYNAAVAASTAQVAEFQNALTSKADTTLGNITSAAGTSLNAVGVRTVIEAYHNGDSWYRVWSDGFCEQGGSASSTGGENNNYSVILLKNYNNGDYLVSITFLRTASTGSMWGHVHDRTGSSFQFVKMGNDFLWQTCGFITEE